MNLLILSNLFVLAPEGDLTQKHLFFLHGKRFIRNQSNRVTRKETYGLFLGSQQGKVFVVYGNIPWLTTVIAQAKAIAFIFFFLRYRSLPNQVGHINRTGMSPSSDARDGRFNFYSDNSRRLSGGWVVWLERGFDSGKIGCVGLDAELRLFTNFLHVGIYVAEQ